MRLNREELLSQLSAVQPGLAPKEITEQATCFVFRDKQVCTFNDEIACFHKTMLDHEGAVQAAPLLSLLNKLKEEEIDVEVEESELVIIGKKRRAGIRMEKEIALPIDDVDHPGKWKKLPEDFCDAISIVEHCAGKDASKFVTCCVHIHPNWIEATDTFQATRYKIETGFADPILVRRDSIKHITSLGMTKFGETSQWVHFKNGAGLVMACRRFVEEFPDIGDLFKVKGISTSLPKGLAEAADIANIFTQELMDNQITVELKPGKLRIKGESTSGWYSEVKKLSYEGEPMKFLIAPKMLIELVQRHNDCVLAKDRLKVNGGKFVYITSLGEAEAD